MNASKLLALVGMITGIVYLTSMHFSSVPHANLDEDRTVELIESHLDEKQARMPQEELREVATTIYEACRRYAVDYRLVLAVMDAESNFRQDVVSRKGAIGIMQVKPIVAREFSEAVGIPYRPHVLRGTRANIHFGVYYLSWLSQHFDNDHAVLFAYNAGFTRARQSITRSSEPKTLYTRKVIKEYQRNCSRFPVI
ncbi:MAG TPA: transglycosylase SLT domain-containing protein [Syntrophales bacterium]|nr:transglycosylase SLT domain-containing protein [Syntrophales bacterium]